MRKPTISLSAVPAFALGLAIFAALGAAVRLADGAAGGGLSPVAEQAILKAALVAVSFLLLVDSRGLAAFGLCRARDVR